MKKRLNLRPKMTKTAKRIDFSHLMKLLSNFQEISWIRTLETFNNEWIRCRKGLFIEKNAVLRKKLPRWPKIVKIYFFLQFSILQRKFLWSFHFFHDLKCETAQQHLSALSSWLFDGIMPVSMKMCSTITQNCRKVHKFPVYVAA